jgi:hypothetical protein
VIHCGGRRKHESVQSGAIRKEVAEEWGVEVYDEMRYLESV